jgi:hypothetical protein
MKFIIGCNSEVTKSHTKKPRRTHNSDAEGKSLKLISYKFASALMQKSLQLNSAPSHSL